MTDAAIVEKRIVPDRGEIIDAVAIVALVGIALLAYRSSYGGVQFMIVGLVAAVIGVAIAAIGETRRWPLLVTIVIAAGVYPIITGALALRHDTIVGVIPTPQSVLESYASAITGWKELITTAPPVGTTGDLMVLPVVVGFVAAFSAYLFARRLRITAVALIPPFVALGLGIAVGIDEPVSILIHGAVMFVVAIGWLAWREHRRRPLLQGLGINTRQLIAAAVVLGVAGAVGFALAPNLPGAEASDREIWRQTVTPPFDPRQYPSPLNGYRQYVKLDRDENGDQVPADVVFTVEGLPEGVPLRLATMDAYDGLVWQVTSGNLDDPSLADSGSFERIGASLEPDVEGELAEVTVTIGTYNDVWIPDVGEVVSLRFTGSEGGAERDRVLAQSFRYNRSTDTAATTLRLQEGDRYEMTVRLPNLLEEMAGQQIDPDVVRLGQARSVPEVVQQLATPDLLVIDDTAERLDRVRELMVGTGAYSDGDIGGGHIRAKAGHSASRLAEFVQDYPRRPFVGNAEQYASTYALLFRDLDRVGTRITMGFLPKEGSLDAPYEVLSTDVEAWVEVPVEGLGWVLISPTPPRDQLSSSSTSPQQPEPDYRTQNPPPPPLVDPEFDQPAKAAGDAQAPDEASEETEAVVPPADDDSVVAGFVSSRAGLVTGIAMTPIILFVLFAAVVVGLKAWRRRRRRNNGPTHQRVANGWKEVTDLAVDMGNPVPPTTTRREAAGMVGPGAVGLADRTDAAVWGGDQLTDEDVDRYWSELSETLTSMKSEVGLLDRVKAAVSIESLKRRSRQPEGG